MKKSKFSEQQVVATLKEVELGAKMGETRRTMVVRSSLSPSFSTRSVRSV